MDLRDDERLVPLVDRLLLFVCPCLLLMLLRFEEDRLLPDRYLGSEFFDDAIA